MSSTLLMKVKQKYLKLIFIQSNLGYFLKKKIVFTQILNFIHYVSISEVYIIFFNLSYNLHNTNMAMPKKNKKTVQYTKTFVMHRIREKARPQKSIIHHFSQKLFSKFESVTVTRRHSLYVYDLNIAPQIDYLCTCPYFPSWWAFGSIN